MIKFGKYGTLTDARGLALHHQDLYAALGLNPKRHLPKEGLPSQTINGVVVWVLPAGWQKGQRTRCECPRCHRFFAAGNLTQHQRFCKGEA